LTLFRIPSYQHDYTFKAADIKLGKGIKVRDGTNLTILTTGPHLKTALNAMESLDEIGLDPEIIHLHTIRPLDVELIRTSVQKTHSILVVEEHIQSGGLGDDVLRTISDLRDVRFASLSIPDVFVTGYGSYLDLCKSVDLTPSGLVSKAKEAFTTTKDS
jgi:transketolase